MVVLGLALARTGFTALLAVQRAADMRCCCSCWAMEAAMVAAVGSAAKVQVALEVAPKRPPPRKRDDMLWSICKAVTGIICWWPCEASVL